MRKVLDGQIRVPEFQRPLKWDVGDVKLLLDSIYRGYPVGTLLLWQRKAGDERLRYGSIVIEAPERHDALLVVDGQQRLRALTQALAGAGHPKEEFAVFFDLRDESFVHIAARDEPAAWHVPMTEVLDSEKLITWVIGRPLSEPERRAVIVLGKRIREFQVPGYLVATDHQAAVQEIFRRANDTGRRMDAHDVFNAIHHREGAAQPANVRDVAAALGPLQFGGPDEATLLQMFAAIRGVDATKERVPQLGAEAHPQMLLLQRSAAATVAFLRRDARIPHAWLLPYRQPLMALARFFARFPEPHPRSRELLARWLWRGALTGEHTGATVRTREMIAAIEDDETKAVHALLATVPTGPTGPTDDAIQEPFNWGSARSKVHALALLDLGPRDLVTGVPLVPAEALVDTPGDSEALRWERLARKILDRPRGDVANILLHGPTRRGLKSAIVACDDTTWLASHAISGAAHRALKFDHDEEFLALRRDALVDVIVGFTGRRAGWGELDAPAVESVLAEDDA